jgi:hypothetical protein
MPQFDKFSFLSQLFWVFLTFGFFYFFLSYYLLPSVSAILKVRKCKLLPAVLQEISVNTDVMQKHLCPPFLFGGLDSFYKSIFMTNFSQIFFLSETLKLSKTLANFVKSTRTCAHFQSALSHFSAGTLEIALKMICSPLFREKHSQK